MPKRGVSVNSLAVRRLREVRQEMGEERLSQIRKHYEDVSRAMAQLSDIEAQSVLLAAASDYTLDALLEKASRPYTLTTQREKRIAMYVADLVAGGMSEEAALELANKHFPPRQRRGRSA